MAASPTLPPGSGAAPRGGARADLALAPPVMFAAWSAALVLGYVALDGASAVFSFEPVPVKPWNPQAGLAVAFVYAGGLRYAVPLFGAAWLSELLLRQSATPLLQLVSAAVLAITLTLTGLAVRRRTLGSGMTTLASVRDFLLIAAVGAALASVLYVGSHFAITGNEGSAFFLSVLYKGLGDLAGIVAVAPLFALLLSPRADTMPMRERPWLDVGVFLLSLAAVIGLFSSVEPDTGQRLLYLLFVPLIVLAMRRGFPGAALGIAIVQAAIAMSLWLAEGSAEDAVPYQLLMVVLGMTTLVLGVVASERRRALSELARRSAELYAQQQALSDAMRISAASETAATLAHELSQPLSAIGTYARAVLEMLRNGTSTPAGLTGVMERIVAESARTRETVQRIRDFFRSGPGPRESVDLGVVVADAVDAVSDRMRANSIALATDVPASIAPVSADRVQLGIVLHNLVGNASDAVADTLPPRWIRITARERGAFVEVEVADSGPGIDPSVRDALFEPLATTKPSGMGLGLPISRTLIQAHGGRLELASLHPTTFRFTLPGHGQLPK